ncbi:MAG: hypothetical protein IKF78_03905 [Atopobiaceae bacterium]|nr:hypothetical protein [Atopobiaceae bacterium]
MPIHEILVALSVAALAADSTTVIRLLARLALAVRGWWKNQVRVLGQKRTVMQGV